LLRAWGGVGGGGGVWLGVGGGGGKPKTGTWGVVLLAPGCSFFGSLGYPQV
jgi:hypothetical protein